MSKPACVLEPCQLLGNTDFEFPAISSSSLQVNQDTVPCWYTTNPSGLIEIWRGAVGPGPYTGNQFIELNSDAVGKLYQNFTAAPGTTITVSYAHAGRTGYPNQMFVQIAQGITSPPQFSTSVTAVGFNSWTYHTFTWTLTGTGTNYTLIFDSPTGGAGGNFLDSITVSLTPPTVTTTGSGVIPSGGIIDISAGPIGVGPFTYSWTGPDGFTSSIKTNAILNATSVNSGIYTVTVTDANGCKAVADANITVTPTPCYVVTDCNGEQTPFLTNSDLSQYVGKTIKTCIGNVPPSIRITTPTPSGCYYLANCCDPTDFLLVNTNITGSNYTGSTITFPILYPGVCWSIMSIVDCTSQPGSIVVNWDTLVEGVDYNVYNGVSGCTICTTAINTPCSIPFAFYQGVNCCTGEMVVIGVTEGVFPYQGLTIQVPTVPALGNQCWTIDKLQFTTDTSNSIVVNPTVETIVVVDCTDPACACVENWPDGCYCATVEIAPNCLGSLPWPGVISQVFDTCEECDPICYVLTDCEGILDPIDVSNNFSAFVGQIVKIDNCDTCWIVSEKVKVATCCYNNITSVAVISRNVTIGGATYTIPLSPADPTVYLNGLNLGTWTYTFINSESYNLCVVGTETYGNFDVLTDGRTTTTIPICTFTRDCSNTVCVPSVTENFATCVDCLPKPPAPLPVNLIQRRVKPGYDTPGCPPEYTEKVLCTFSEAAYDEMVKVRYGITICCDEDIDAWDVKRQILELKAIFDPNPLPPPPLPTCYCWEITAVDGGCAYDYIDCNGVNQTITLHNDVNYVCSTVRPTLNLLSPICKTTPSVVNLGVCTDLSICNNIPCYCWDIELAPSQTCDFDYVDCDGNILTINCIEGHNAVCSRILPYHAGEFACIAPIAVTNLGDCAICQIPVLICHCYSIDITNLTGDDITYTACDGNIVTVNLPAPSTVVPYYVCSYTIPTGGLGTTITEVGDCGKFNGCSVISACHYFVVTSTGSITIPFTYTDCLGNPVGSFIDPGQSITICAQGGLDSPSIFVTFVDTNINCTV